MSLILAAVLCCGAVSVPALAAGAPFPAGQEDGAAFGSEIRYGETEEALAAWRNDTVGTARVQSLLNGETLHLQKTG